MGTTATRHSSRSAPLGERSDELDALLEVELARLDVTPETLRGWLRCARLEGTNLSDWILDTLDGRAAFLRNGSRTRRV